MSTSAWSQPSDALINNLKQSSQQGTNPQQNADQPARDNTAPQKKTGTQVAGKGKKKPSASSGASAGNALQQSGGNKVRKEGAGAERKENGSASRASGSTKFSTKERYVLNGASRHFESQFDTVDF